MTDLPTGEALEARLVDLESRLAFQENALAELSDALADSRAETARATLLLNNVLGDLRQLRSLMYADPASEPPPPHY